MAENRGLPVAAMTQLRAKARASGVYFRVVKNTLVRRAVADTPFASLADKMVGPLAYGIGADPVAVAKVLNDFAKGNDKFVITGGSMADGTPVDIVLNPLGVPSRMNVGQILEIHLGWAAKGLGHRIAELLTVEKNTAEVRKFLSRIYNGTGKPEDIESLDDHEIGVLADNLKDGVPFATPVFDGATEAEIKDMIHDDNGRERERHKVPYGATMLVKDGDVVKAGKVLATWDATSRPIITEYAGRVKFENVEEGVTVAKQVDEVTGLSTLVVIDPKRRAGAAAKGVRPQVKLLDENGDEIKLPGSELPVNITFQLGSIITVKDGQDVAVGEVLARIPQETSKTRDITGGLPRVAELFEARSPKDKGMP